MIEKLEQDTAQNQYLKLRWIYPNTFLFLLQKFWIAYNSVVYLEKPSEHNQS